MKLSPKQAIRLFFLCNLILCNVFVYALYVYDPLQVFHLSWLQDNLHWHSNMREQAAGIIKHDDFDSIIMGSSIFLDFSAIEASNGIGGDFVNLSIADGDFYERSVVLDFALRNKSIKRIVGSLDGPSNGVREGSKKYPLQSWLPLYDDNPVNDITIYLNDKFVGCLLTFSKREACTGMPIYKKGHGTWVYAEPALEKYGGGLAQWAQHVDNEDLHAMMKNVVVAGSVAQMDAATRQQINQAYARELNKNIQDIVFYIERTLLDLVRRYPKTVFDFFDYPFSRLFFSMLVQANRPGFAQYAWLLTYMVEQSEKYDNFTIYGLNDEAFLDDIRNYRDLIHFRPEMTSRMIAAVAQKRHVLTLDNVRSYLAQVEKKALQYDLVGSAGKIQEILSQAKAR